MSSSTCVKLPLSIHQWDRLRDCGNGYTRGDSKCSLITGICSLCIPSACTFLVLLFSFIRFEFSALTTSMPNLLAIKARHCRSNRFLFWKLRSWLFRVWLCFINHSFLRLSIAGLSDWLGTGSFGFSGLATTLYLVPLLFLSSQYTPPTMDDIHRQMAHQQMADWVWGECCPFPQVVITDQSKGMIKSLKEMMPYSFYQLCEWHMFQNFKKRLPESRRYDKDQCRVQSFIYIFGNIFKHLLWKAYKQLKTICYFIYISRSEIIFMWIGMIRKAQVLI